jgi:group I intron endonuclease
MGLSGIYKIQSKIHPERCYIGSAVNIRHRWGNHLWHLKKNTHNPKLQNHYNKYGKDDLVFSILVICNKEELIPVDGIIWLEQSFIYAYRPWFNVSSMAGSNLGLRLTKEQCEKRRGRVPWNKGTHIGVVNTTSFKLGQPAWNKGKKMTKEHMDKLILWGSGHVPWNVGMKMSEEFCAATSEGHKGFKQSQEHIDKRVAKIIGHRGANKGGINKALMIPIIQYNPDMSFVKEWDSKASVVRELRINNISRCLSGKSFTAGGFIWEYKLNKKVA